MANKRCRINYRLLSRGNNQFPERSFSDVLKGALEKKIGREQLKNNISERISPPVESNNYQRVINNLHFDDEYVFGNLCLFSPGELQALLELEGKQKHGSLEEALDAWKIAERKAPSGYEYLHGISYWLAIGDHFYQIQHVAIQVKAMEEYFSWLLREKAGAIDTDQCVELQAKFDRSQVGGDLGDISTVEIGGLVPETVAEPGAMDSQIKVIESEMHGKLAEGIAQGWSKSRDIIEQLFGEVEATRILESVPDEAALEVKVNIGYRARKRKLKKAFMDELASGLRNIPDGEIRIRGRDGEVKGNDARLQTDMQIKKVSKNSSLLDLEHTLEQMLEVHRRFLHDGKIG